MTQWVVAMPVRKSGWKIICLASGVEVRTVFKDDEYPHYVGVEDDQKYVLDGQLQACQPADLMTLARKITAKRRRLAARGQAKTRAPLDEKHTGHEGKKKGLMILADFEDVGLNEMHTKELY